MQCDKNRSVRSVNEGQATADKGSGQTDYEKPKSVKSVSLPDGFALNADGLFYIEPATEDKPEVKTWIGPPLRFVAMTRNGESVAWGLLLSWYDPDGKPHWWAMPYSMLNDARQGWRSELASGGWIGATSQKARGLLGHLLAAVRVYDRARCVDCTGWHGAAYVLPDEVIGQEDERLVLQASMAINPFTQSGTIEGWQQTIGTWARGNRLLVFAISTALSGPLLELAGIDSGGVHFWGHSSTGKTTVMRAAWSVVGGREGVRTWRSTSNALEAISALHNDTLLCLDEIGQAPARTVGESAYMIANGQGKSRSQTDGSARNIRSWRTVLLSNGEMTMADKMREDGQHVRAGQEVRIIDIPADAGAGMGAWEDLHGYETPGQFSDAVKAACTENYGLLGRAFIRELVRRRDELNLTKDLSAVVSAWTPTGSSGQVRRVVSRFALAGLAGEVAVAFRLVPWTEGEALAAAKQCLDTWMEGRGSSGDREDHRAVEMVRSFIGRFGGSRFQHIDSEVSERILDRAGFRREAGEHTQFLFTKEQFQAMLTGLNLTTAAKSLARAGLLRRNDKNLTVQVTLPDLGKVRVYAVQLPDDGGQSC
ncbi:MAG: DUF927 domain-containing protein [Proteobacteria bacterium]|nr:DUF927 domain-containing protein [Pseudomonadota bacterium]